MADNDFIIHHDEPEKTHEDNPTNEIEESANNTKITLEGLVEKSVSAMYSSSGELEDVVNNLIDFCNNIPATELANELYCKQIQEVANRVSQSVQAKLQEILQKALAKLNVLLAPIQAIISANPTDLGSVINFCNAVISFFTAFYTLINGLITNITALINTLQKLAQVPPILASKASQLGCSFTPPNTNSDTIEETLE